jgi:hypothetical protein
MKSISKMSIAVYVLVIGFCPVLAFAFTAPASGSFAFSVYDLFMNEILTGAIGFVIAAGLVLYALFWAVRSNVFGTIVCAICAGLIIFIEDVVISLGVDITDIEAFVTKGMF